MPLPRADAPRSLTAAFVCSGLIGAQFAAASATRDTFFLTTMDVATRPAVVAASAGLSILLALLHWLAVRHASPATVVPGTFVISAVLLLLDWALVTPFPGVAAQALFLQTNALGPLLGAGFWLIVTERTDPRTAKVSFGRIASAGTLAGLAGALAAAYVSDVFGVGAMLPVLAALNLATAWRVRRLAHVPATPRVMTVDDDTVPADSPGVLSPANAARLALVILLGTVSATCVEHLMNVQADATLRPESLPRFFSAYYAGVSILVFTVQTAFVSQAFGALGLGLAMSSPSLVLGAGGVGALLFPSLVLVTAAYGSMSVLYDSLFRSAKEVFFTPVSRAEQRRMKLFVDVAPTRLGAVVGAGLVALATRWWIEHLYAVLLLAAIACSGAAAAMAARLTLAYVGNLRRSLIQRGAGLDPIDAGDLTTRTVMLRTPASRRAPPSAAPPTSPPTAVSDVALVDAELSEIRALRLGDPEQIRAVLRARDGVGALVPYVIPLLASDPVADEAVQALRMVAEEHIGALLDALLNPNQPFAVRRRLARVLSVCVSQRAVDGLQLGLDDMRFEVRFHCGRSLLSILQKNARIRIDRDRVLDVVRREIAVGRPVWDSHRLLEDMNSEEHTFVDEFVKDRAGQGLGHVFTLLSVVLPTEPLEVAYRGVHTDDQSLRGTALEYLAGVLPADVYDRLAPFIGGAPRAPAPTRPRDEILADLLGSNKQIMLNLEELRRRTEA